MKYFKVTKETTAEELKAQYRKAAKQTHPDKGGSKEAFTEMQHEFERAVKSVGNKKGMNELTTWAEFEVEFEKEHGDLNAMLDDLEKTDKIKVETNRVIKVGIYALDKIFKKMGEKK